MKTQIEKIYDNKRKEYFNTLDRIYLNKEALKKMGISNNSKTYKEIESRIAKDQSKAEELEKMLGL